MREHDAERFGILPLSGTRHLGLRLELGCSFPQVPVEEEQTRLEFDLGEMQVRVDQRTERIDVEIGNAGQHPRLLPTKKAVTCRNEAQLPAELVQRGCGQTFD